MPTDTMSTADLDALAFMVAHGAPQYRETQLLSGGQSRVFMLNNAQGEFFTFWNRDQNHETLFLGAWYENLRSCFGRLMGKTFHAMNPADVSETVEHVGSRLEAAGYPRRLTADTILLFDAWSGYHMPHQGKQMKKRDLLDRLASCAALAALDINYYDKVDAAERQIPASTFTTYAPETPYTLI